MNSFYTEDSAPHLGGYIIGGDDATYYPELWDWFIKRLDVTSVLDVGCGEGHSLEWFREHECRVMGVDGIPQDDPDIKQWDYTDGPLAIWDPFDLVWSCEFVEHVDEQYLPNFVHTFIRGDIIAMTFAEPGQQGHHHVNCQDASYWRGVMAAAGYHYQELLTEEGRWMASKNRSPYNHFARSGLIFTRFSVD